MAHLLLCVSTRDAWQQLGVTVEPDEELPANLETLLEVVVTLPQDPQGSRGKTPPFLLAAPGLLTVWSKLAQLIWDLDFIELEELLPSNKTIQALEGGAPYRTEGNHLGLVS